MNRKQRRAAHSQSPAPGRSAASASAAELMAMFERAVAQQSAGELGAAAHLYKKILAQRPDHFAACYRLALLYLAQDKLDKASAQFVELADIAPQTLVPFATVKENLRKLVPSLAVELATGAVPDLAAGAHDLMAIIADPYFQTVLERSVVYDAALERWLTFLRASVLRFAQRDESDVDAAILAFCASLARQCFINEYVFAVSDDERMLLEQLQASVTEALSRGAVVAPMRLLALAMYRPLNEIAGAQALASRSWPKPIDDVVTQQVREPEQERALRGTIPRLTPIAEGVTAQVRAQYEENPYPRWASLAAPPWPLVTLDDHLRRLFPSTPFVPPDHGDHLDILVAGCGTGRHALELAQSYRGARVLAVDLSLASLASAKRRMPQRLSGAIEFAQADIMALGSIGRSFDMINVGGVLHHMPDPWGGWRELIKLLRPNGLMQVGLYSAHARRDVVTARKIIAERGYQATSEDIRRLRHDLVTSADKFSFMELDDFFTVSTCRDLLFHVHEVQVTIPEIAAFLDANGLKFVGFDFGDPQRQEHYRNLFARNGWSLGNLERWDEFERQNPALFAGMYIFWVQKV